MFIHDYWLKFKTIEQKWLYLIAFIYAFIAFISFISNTMVIFYLLKYNKQF